MVKCHIGAIVENFTPGGKNFPYQMKIPFNATQPLLKVINGCGVMSLHHSHSSLLRSKITLKRSQNTLKQAETVFQPSVYR